MNFPPVGPKATQLVCPSCKANILSRVDHTPNTGTHIMACLLCPYCCGIFSCIPHCKDSCRNADHYCPSCKAYLGTYHR